MLTLQMDYHKCLRTRKVSPQDGFHARKLRTNLFGIYYANEDIIHCFLYDESIGRSSPNKVISLLNYLLKSLQEKHGKFHHLILWADNSPAQFKESYLFFYLDNIVRKGKFRVDLKFLLERHSFSICDRRFGCIQQFFNTKEKIETRALGATISGLHHRCRLRSKNGWAEFSYLKMVLARALVFQSLVEGNKDFGNEIASVSKILRREKHNSCSRITHIRLA